MRSTAIEGEGHAALESQREATRKADQAIFGAAEGTIAAETAAIEDDSEAAETEFTE